MIAKISLLSLLFFTGCAPAILEIDPELQEYVTYFEELHGQEITDLKASFGDTTVIGKNVVGYCRFGMVPEIVVSREYWDRSDYLSREELMFHELGHCVLDRDHNDSKFEDGCPKSFMYKYVISRSCIEAHREEYLAEMFGRNV